MMISPHPSTITECVHNGLAILHADFYGEHHGSFYSLGARLRSDGSLVAPCGKCRSAKVSFHIERREIRSRRSRVPIQTYSEVVKHEEHDHITQLISYCTECVRSYGDSLGVPRSSRLFRILFVPPRPNFDYEQFALHVRASLDPNIYGTQTGSHQAIGARLTASGLLETCCTICQDRYIEFSVAQFDKPDPTGNGLRPSIEAVVTPASAGSYVMADAAFCRLCATTDAARARISAENWFLRHD